MTNPSMKEELLSVDSFASNTSTNSSSPDFQYQSSHPQAFCTSTFESCASSIMEESNEERLTTLSQLFRKSEHQLGDTNFKFFKYNPRVTSYSIAISSILTLAVFTYMILFREQMFIFSLEFIESMQSNQNIFLTSFMNFISLCVSPKPVISLLVIFFALSTQKLKILTFLLYYGFLTYTCVTLKSLFADPRPFWIESQLPADGTTMNNTSGIDYASKRLLNQGDPVNPDTFEKRLNLPMGEHYDQFSNVITVEGSSNVGKQQSNFTNLPENALLTNSLISDQAKKPEIRVQAKRYSKEDESNVSEYSYNQNPKMIQKNSIKTQSDLNSTRYPNSGFLEQKQEFQWKTVQEESSIQNDQNNKQFGSASKYLNQRKYYPNQQENKNRHEPENNNSDDISEADHSYSSTNQFGSNDLKNQIEFQKNSLSESEIRQKMQTQLTTNAINQEDAHVQPLDWKCYQEFGNPSGHAFLGVPLYEFIVRDYILRKISRDQRVYRVLVAISAVILVNLIFLSRMYLGMHSLNQVIFGFVLGIYATVFYRLFFERRISTMLYSYVQLKRGNAFKQILKVIIFTSIIFSIPVIVYAIQEQQLSQSPSLQEQFSKWEAVIKQKCGSYDKLQSFHHKCFIDASVVAIGFAIILGFLLTSRENFLKGQYKEAHGIKNSLIRIIIILCCCSNIAIFYYAIPSFQNPYLKYIYLFIGTFITGFLLVALVPKLFEKYSLITITIPFFEEFIDCAQNNQKLTNLNQEINTNSFTIKSNTNYVECQSELVSKNTGSEERQQHP